MYSRKPHMLNGDWTGWLGREESNSRIPHFYVFEMWR
jgi:hypothetical protein